MSVLSLLLVVCCLVPLAVAQDWPRFRGPNGSGISESAAEFPIHFGEDKNLLWKIRISQGHSSPVIAGERLYYTAADDKYLLTGCVDTNTGRHIWIRSIERSQRLSHHPNNGSATPTPTTDGQQVYAFFPEFGLVCYRSDGKERWRLPLGPFRNSHGMASSPILWERVVLLVCDQDVGSFLVAVETSTGFIRWKCSRQEIVGAAYSTPVLVRRDDNIPELIVSGGFQLAAYSISTGTKEWWVGGFPMQPKSSPIAGKASGREIIFTSYQSSGEGGSDFPSFGSILESVDLNQDRKISADESAAHSFLRSVFLQIDINGDGYVSEQEYQFLLDSARAPSEVVAIVPRSNSSKNEARTVWRYRKAVPNVPTPLLYRGVLYLLKEGGILTGLDAPSGNVLKQGRLSNVLDPYFASPVAGHGKVFVVSQQGNIVVLRAGRDWEVIATNSLGEECFATPALSNGRVFVRTNRSLFCFGYRRK